MTEFVPLGERIEMEEVMAEPTADRVSLVLCVYQVGTGNLLLQVIALLNEAQLYDKEEKLNCLHKVRLRLYIML